MRPVITTPAHTDNEKLLSAQFTTCQTASIKRLKLTHLTLKPFC